MKVAVITTGPGEQHLGAGRVASYGRRQTRRPWEAGSTSGRLRARASPSRPGFRRPSPGTL